MTIYYKRLPCRFKYELTREFKAETRFRLPAIISCFNGQIDTGGALTLFPGFLWDGPSGPALDTPSFMAGSAVHDWLYRAIRYNFIPYAEENRKFADEACLAICKSDGMPAWRRAYVWAALRWFASYAIEEAVPVEEEAP